MVETVWAGVVCFGIGGKSVACFLRPSESGNRDKDGETDNQMIWRLKYKLCRKQPAKNLEVAKGRDIE